jgi:hypothetical protein
MKSQFRALSLAVAVTLAALVAPSSASAQVCCAGGASGSSNCVRCVNGPENLGQCDAVRNQWGACGCSWSYYLEENFGFGCQEVGTRECVNVGQTCYSLAEVRGTEPACSPWKPRKTASKRALNARTLGAANDVLSGL